MNPRFDQTALRADAYCFTLDSFGISGETPLGGEEEIMMRRMVIALALVCGGGCKKNHPVDPALQQPTPKGSGAAKAGASAPAAETPELEERDQLPAGMEIDPEPAVKPVFPAGVTPHPVASKLCEALHEIPNRRRAECCERKAPVSVSKRCVDIVSTALADGAIVVSLPDVEACLAAQTALHQGCDWVSITAPRAAEVCRGLYRGQRNAGQACRSSLECVGDMTCRGVGPTQEGVCGEARAEGAVCGAGIDPIGPFVRLVDGDLPSECAGGFCQKNRCRAYVAAGGACTGSAQCVAGKACVGGVCGDPVSIPVGQACDRSGCVEGARCVGGQCILPKPAGAECRSHFECRGACYDGRCDKMCRPIRPLPAIPPKKIAPSE